MQPCFVRAGIVALAGLLMSLISAFAQNSGPLPQRIDQLVAAGKADYAKEVASVSSDAEFLRRVYLDLTGMVPSVAETRAFLADKSPDKRQQLIERLLQSDAYSRNMQTLFDNLFMDRRAEKHVKRAEWQAFLLDAFAKNKPYDQLVTEILSADGSDPKTRPAARFYLDRDGESNVLTKDISRLFLGMNLQCCQCHDHPLINAYKQDHYFGLLAFLNRSFIYTDKGSKISILAEKGEGEVSFQSVFKAKITNSTGPKLPFGSLVEEPKFEKGQEYVVAFKPGEKPQPKYSRRAQLAKQITTHPQFSRSTANRLWAQFLGRGIVQPVDQDHEANPPSHPELLKALGDDFAGRKFDMKGFIKDIVSSKTYQLSSEVPKGAKDVKAADFTVAGLRPLTPEQLAWSLMQATGLIDAERKAQPKADEKTILAKLSPNVQTFINLFGTPAGEAFDPANYQATLDQTLFINNGPLLRGWLAPRPGNLTQRLSELKDADALADELYLSVLNRPAMSEEKEEVARFLTQRAADRAGAIQDLAWALLASTEFRFNH